MCLSHFGKMALGFCCNVNFCTEQLLCSRMEHVAVKLFSFKLVQEVKSSCLSYLDRKAMVKQSLRLLFLIKSFMFLVSSVLAAPWAASSAIL